MISLAFVSCADRSKTINAINKNLCKSNERNSEDCVNAKKCIKVYYNFESKNALDNSPDLSKQLIDNIAAWVKKDEYKSIVLRGFAVSEGPRKEESAQELSKARAANILTELESRNASNGVVIGQSETVACNASVESRRVEVIYN